MADISTPKPPYRRIADELRAAIESGELAAGTRLPTIQALAAGHGVSTNTAQKALKVLRDAGLIEGVPGYGVFVRE